MTLGSHRNSPPPRVSGGISHGGDGRKPQNSSFEHKSHQTQQNVPAALPLTLLGGREVPVPPIRSCGGERTERNVNTREITSCQSLRVCPLRSRAIHPELGD